MMWGFHSGTSGSPDRVYWRNGWIWVTGSTSSPLEPNRRIACGREGEILVVDNASTDGTRQAVELFVRQGVRYLRNDVNRGKGYSIRRGMLEASGELRLMCDADCTPSLASLPAMVAATEAADVVVGSRVVEGARVARHQPLGRRVFGLGFLI